MKVLMLGWELPPHNSGGLGVACYQLCRSLSARGIDIEFVLPYTATKSHDVGFMKVIGAYPQDVSEVVMSAVAYDSYKFIKSDGSVEWISLHDQHALYEISAARLAEGREFDLIHAHDWLTFRAGLRIKQQSNKPLVLHVHSIEADRSGGKHGNPVVREIEATSMLLADQIVAVSNHTKQAIIREYLIPEEKISVVHNGIESEDLAELNDVNAYAYLAALKNHGYKVVVNVGRLTIQKGLPQLLMTAQKTVEHCPKTIFLIVGSGEQETELIMQAAELGIAQNVLFAGFQRGKNWRDAFTIADLFVMPSVSEPFGLTALESVGFNTPVLISKQSGVSEVLRNCLKVDFWDTDEMANQISGVLRSQALADTIKQNAVLELDNLSWGHSSRKLHELYAKHMELPAA